MFARLRPIGVELSDIVSVYNGFNTAARISGASAIESSNAFRQLSQALGSGALRGDEFNSVSEQVPGILTAIAQESGVAQGQLRAFAAEGRITSDIVIRALKRIETEGADQLKAALGGPAQAMVDFQNATEKVQVALTRDIVPEIAKVFTGLAELIVNLEGPIRFIGRVTANTLGQINSLIVAATQPGTVSARRDIEAGMLPLNIQGAEELFKGTGPGGKGLAGMREESVQLAKLRRQNKRDVLLELMQNRLKTMDGPLETGPTGGVPQITTTLLTDKAPKGRTKKERVDMSQAMLELLQQRIKLSKEENAVAVALKENEIETLAIQEENLLPRQKIAALLQAEEKLHKNLRGIHDKNLGLFMQQKRIAEEAGEAFAKDFLERAAKQTDVLKDALQGVGNILQNQLMNVFDGLINKTLNFNDVLRTTLSQIGVLLMNAGLNNLAGPMGSGGILSFLGFGTPGKAANGGPVEAGRPYMVGERGPEMFIPGSSGGIMRNEDMRQLMGRSPAGVGAPQMNFTFETTNIGGTEFVSREQLEQAMVATRRQATNDGAKRGMSMTLDKMQNSPRTRSRIGIRS